MSTGNNLSYASELADALANRLNRYTAAELAALATADDPEYRRIHAHVTKLVADLPAPTTPLGW